MKRLLLFAALLCAVTLAIGSSFVSNASKAGQKQKASMTFTEPVRLQGVVLKGEYLFVHDDAAMMRGEACTFFYKGNVETSKNLIVSFHCIPKYRSTEAIFTVRSVLPLLVDVGLLGHSFGGCWRRYHIL